jgi:hypothetical protein
MIAALSPAPRSVKTSNDRIALAKSKDESGAKLLQIAVEAALPRVDALARELSAKSC